MRNEHVFQPNCMESKEFVRVTMCVWFCHIAKDISAKISRSRNFYKFSQGFSVVAKFHIFVNILSFHKKF
jgi:hypothetical protein